VPVGATGLLLDLPMALSPLEIRPVAPLTLIVPIWILLPRTPLD